MIYDNSNAWNRVYSVIHNNMIYNNIDIVINHLLNNMKYDNIKIDSNILKSLLQLYITSYNNINNMNHTNINKLKLFIKNNFINSDGNTTTTTTNNNNELTYDIIDAYIQIIMKSKRKIIFSNMDLCDFIYNIYDEFKLEYNPIIFDNILTHLISSEYTYINNDILKSIDNNSINILYDNKLIYNEFYYIYNNIITKKINNILLHLNNINQNNNHNNNDDNITSKLNECVNELYNILNTLFYINDKYNIHPNNKIKYNINNIYQNLINKYNLNELRHSVDIQEFYNNYYNKNTTNKNKQYSNKDVDEIEGDSMRDIDINKSHGNFDDSDSEIEILTSNKYTTATTTTTTTTTDNNMNEHLDCTNNRNSNNSNIFRSQQEPCIYELFDKLQRYYESKSVLYHSNNSSSRNGSYDEDTGLLGDRLNYEYM
jgi:hypothetical protein